MGQAQINYGVGSLNSNLSTFPSLFASAEASKWNTLPSVPLIATPYVQRTHYIPDQLCPPQLSIIEWNINACFCRTEPGFRSSLEISGIQISYKSSQLLSPQIRGQIKVAINMGGKKISFPLFFWPSPFPAL